MNLPFLKLSNCSSLSIILCLFLSAYSYGSDLIPETDDIFDKYALDVASSGDDSSEDSLEPIKPIITDVALSEIRFGKISIKTTFEAFRSFDIITAESKRNGEKPLVLILDPEIWVYYHEGIDRLRFPDRYYGAVVGTPNANLDKEVERVQDPTETPSQVAALVERTRAQRETSLQVLDQVVVASGDRYRNTKTYQSFYTWSSPISSNLLRKGYTVGIPHPKVLADIRILNPEDWTAVINNIASKKNIAADSIFLVATHEYADLAFKIATSSNLNAIIVEEPSVPINSSPVNGVWPPTSGENPWASLRELSELDYVGIFKAIDEKFLFVRDKKSPFFEYNNYTMIDALLAARKEFLVALLDETPRIAKDPDLPLRIHKKPLNESEIQAYKYTYNDRSMRKMIDRTIAFIDQNTLTRAIPLPNRGWKEAPPGSKEIPNSGVLAPWDTPIEQAAAQEQPNSR